MVRITSDAVFIENETIELGSQLNDEYGLVVTGCLVRFPDSRSMLEDLAVNPDNDLDVPAEFHPPVRRIGVFDGDFRIEGQVVIAAGPLPKLPRIIVKDCKVVTNGFALDPGLLMGTFEVVD